jgi:hypothetical protein
LCISRDAIKAQTRYDEWEALKQQAIKNWESSGAAGPLPKALTTPPPPRPLPLEDEEMTDVLMDTTTDAGMESFASDGEAFKMELVSIMCLASFLYLLHRLD